MKEFGVEEEEEEAEGEAALAKNATALRKSKATTGTAEGGDKDGGKLIGKEARELGYVGTRVVRAAAQRGAHPLLISVGFVCSTVACFWPAASA